MSSLVPYTGNAGRILAFVSRPSADLPQSLDMCRGTTGRIPVMVVTAVFVFLTLLGAATLFAVVLPQRTVGAEDRVAVLFRWVIVVAAVLLIVSPVLPLPFR